MTVIRTLAALGLAVLSLREASLAYLVASYLTYWVGDIADGALARRTGQETRTGAVLDITSDRLCTTTAAAAFIVVDPAVALPIGIFLAQFCILDTMLTLGFLPFGVLSPNYFYLADEHLYRLNWSAWAKATNTSSVVIACLLGWYPLAAAIAAGFAMAKVYSLWRMTRLMRRLAVAGTVS